MKRLDLTGQRFARLFLVERVSSKPGYVSWRCSCDCGSSTIVTTHSLRSGNTTSCGCVRLERFRASACLPNRSGRAYRVWKDMKSRCRNNKVHNFASYGGRGILVCDKWLSFDAFYADMGEPPPGLTLERKDVNGNYDPANCCWATHRVQNNNHRKHVRVLVDGTGMNLSQACERLGLNYHTVYARMFAYGWGEQRALGLA